MNTVIRKIGNSEGVIIPKEVLEQAGLKSGDNLQIVSDGSELRLVKAKDDFEKEIAIAREFMTKYHDALSKLAK